MRRLTIFDTLNRSPESSTSRALITASSGFGLTKGSYKAETISLTERGRAIVERNDPEAKLDAVMGVDVFAQFFEHYENSALPSAEAASDFLKSKGIPEKSVKKCLKILIASGRAVGLIQSISGTERVVSRGHALDTLSRASDARSFGDEKEVIPEQAYGGAKELGKPAQKYPNIHIDLQIHISPETTAEQMDDLFASIAKHIYGKD